MLYDEFNSYQSFADANVFKNKALEKTEIFKNLNPAFLMREYQKEALGRFFYYYENYPQVQKPIHLMFNMATGSGKTLVMAASILYLYKKGYRNFIFFTRLGNIIQKTKANFLDPNSKKYLFADKISFFINSFLFLAIFTQFIFYFKFRFSLFIKDIGDISNSINPEFFF